MLLLLIWWLVGFGSLQAVNYVTKCGFFSETEPYDWKEFGLEVGIGFAGFVMILPAVLIIMEEIKMRKFKEKNNKKE